MSNEGFSDYVFDKRIVGALEPSSQSSYGSGVNSFRTFCLKFNSYPSFTTESELSDVSLLISWIHYLFHDEHLQPSTIGEYMTGLKSALLLADIQSPALACSGKLHPAVSRALRSLLHDSEADPHPRRAEYSVDFLQQGRDLWPMDIFALAVLIRIFFLRSGEILKQGTKWSPHILHWSHVVFLDAFHEVIPPSQWTSSIAHFARLRQDSRKHQPRGQVRETPERARCYFPLSGNIVDGLLDHDNRACAVAVLQGLFVFSNAATRYLDSPICMRANRT